MLMQTLLYERWCKARMCSRIRYGVDELWYKAFSMWPSPRGGLGDEGVAERAQAERRRHLANGRAGHPAPRLGRGHSGVAFARPCLAGLHMNIGSLRTNESAGEEERPHGPRLLAPRPRAGSRR